MMQAYTGCKRCQQSHITTPLSSRCIRLKGRLVKWGFAATGGVVAAVAPGRTPIASSTHLDQGDSGARRHVDTHSQDADSAQVEFKVQAISSIDKVSQQEWDSVVLAQDEVNPFLKWSFLHALEASQSAVGQEGWGPQHLLLRDAGSDELVGCCPLYLKGHSQGEYVFDSSWANYSHMMGKRYYPKLQSCVPFTPATGSRLLVRPGLQQHSKPLVFKALAKSLMAVTEHLDASSLHITFPTGQEWGDLGQMGFQQRRGIQYHWHNRGYASFENFLGDLKQRKRKSIRQERKSVHAQGLTIKRLLGSEVSSTLWDKFYNFYQLTIDKWWGRPYLTREFFHRVGEDMGEEVLLVVAEQQGETVAAALNFIGSHCLFGRNWGCAPGKEFKHLHFELCYYQAIEEAIERQLPRVEAGAQGEHKLQRGLLPNFTYSAHHLRDTQLRAAVQKFLDREEAQVLYTWQALTQQGSPYKDDTTLSYMIDTLSSIDKLSWSSGSESSGDDSTYASSDEGHTPVTAAADDCSE